MVHIKQKREKIILNIPFIELDIPNLPFITIVFSVFKIVPKNIGLKEFLPTIFPFNSKLSAPLYFSIKPFFLHLLINFLLDLKNHFYLPYKDKCFSYFILLSKPQTLWGRARVSRGRFY